MMCHIADAYTLHTLSLYYTYHAMHAHAMHRCTTATTAAARTRACSVDQIPAGFLDLVEKHTPHVHQEALVESTEHPSLGHAHAAARCSACVPFPAYASQALP